MSQSLCGVFIHLVFSTKNRAPLIVPGIRDRLYEYLGGILSQKGCTPVLQGGVADHVHCLFVLNPVPGLSEIIRELKAGSSKWIHESFPEQSGFAWQAGYGAFSVSASNLEGVKRYIAAQEEHHRKGTFQEEYVSLLKKYDIPYDEKYIWT